MKITNDFGNKMKGSIGEQVTASDWKGRNYLKAYSRPSNPSSTEQQEKRGWLAEGTAKWQSFTTRQREAYILHERFYKQKLSPFNSFMKVFMAKKVAGDAYTDPMDGFIQLVDDVTSGYIQNATVTLYLAYGSVVYFNNFLDGVQRQYWGLAIEDNPFRLRITHPDYVTYDTPTRSTTYLNNDNYRLTPI